MGDQDEYLIKELDTIKNDVKLLQQALYTLVEAQRNTVSNIDMLTKDIKEIVNLTYENESIKTAVQKDIEHFGKRVEELEKSRVWVIRLIIGSVFSIITAVVVKIMV